MMNVLILIALITGWLAGLLVNYLSDVLPLTRRFSQPTCRNCGKKFQWSDYLLLKPCQDGHRRSLRTWFVQALVLGAAIYIWFFPPRILGYWLGLILLVYFFTILVIDLEHRLILHPTSFFGAFLGFGFGILLHGLIPTLIGGLAGFGIMFALYYLGVLFTRYLSRRRGEPIEEEALGFGDVNLGGILGLLLGWPLIWIGLLASILIGGLASLILIVGMLFFKKYQAFTAIPYAPFLILGTILLLYR
jgi:hypothetical protein